VTARYRGVEPCCLPSGPREAVEQRTRWFWFAGGNVQEFGVDDPDRDFVRNQLASIEKGFGECSELGAARHRRSKEFASRKMDEVVARRNPFGLRTLSGALRPHQDHVVHCGLRVPLLQHSVPEPSRAGVTE